MMSRHAGAGILAFLCVSVASPPRAPASEQGADPAAIALGERIVIEAECGRCHGTAALPAIEAAPRERSCSDCHAWIHATAGKPDEIARYRREYPKWAAYTDHVKSFLAVPDLAAAARLDPAWIARFVRHPYKVRPGFPEAMIRTSLSDRDARAVAAYLASQAAPLQGLAREAAAIPPSSAPGDVAEGERLYGTLACASCHLLGSRSGTPGIPDAPDLAHAGDRMTPAAIAAFIADPPALAAGGAIKMPSYGLRAVDAARLRDFLLAAGRLPAGTAPPAAEPAADLPPLARRVTWKEVNDAVFSRICTHCHSDGRLTGGDGGPGNTGGLGYRGAGLDLGSLRAITRGAVRDGRRQSILEPGADGGEPILVARLRARMIEHARETARGAARLAIADLGDAPPGMPLGLPPLSPEAFQLVRSWVAQGAR